MISTGPECSIRGNDPTGLAMATGRLIGVFSGPGSRYVATWVQFSLLVNESASGHVERGEGLSRAAADESSG
jgi:hypothetical protein